MKKDKSGLFGVSGKSNRDTTRKSHWGKNEFNSSFPTALLCYMHSIGKKAIYLKMDKQLKIYHDTLSTRDLFQIEPTDPEIYFSFEDAFSPFQGYVRGQLPRSDVVIMDNSDKKNPMRKGFEVKLTALPDSSTFEEADDKQSCEMVFRPTAIVHLALSISHLFVNRKKELSNILSPVCSKVFNWRSPEDIAMLTSEFIEALNKAFITLIDDQEAFIIQPIWKTIGKASVLHENCLDVFIWSNFAFTRLFFDSVANGAPKRKMTRQQRCIFWLGRMLYDFAQNEYLNPALIASEMAYKLQTDKAFSVSGVKSWNYLKCAELTKPRISKKEIRNIILGNGYKLLSPERRFDAALVNTPGLFD